MPLGLLSCSVNYTIFDEEREGEGADSLLRSSSAIRAKTRPHPHPHPPNTLKNEGRGLFQGSESNYSQARDLKPILFVLTGPE